MSEPIRCVFCQETGVHDCPGGEYRTSPHEPAFGSMHVMLGTQFPGQCDAEATRGFELICAFELGQKPCPAHGLSACKGCEP